MKKLLFIAIVAALTMGACKTNEANYRDAYEKAKAKRTETGDSATTSALRSASDPKPLTVDGITVPALTMPVRVTKKVSPDAVELARYCVVVAQFRQIFNARSMSERLREQGFDGAFVVEDRDQNYYVVAGTTGIIADAVALMDRLNADPAVVLRAPYPYVLRPAQLVR